MSRRYCPDIIKKLPQSCVFVFGSNLGGFHGAGAAGVAMRGTAKNNWRDDVRFLKAMKSPPGSPARLGRWATFGVGKGFQKGRYGLSYAIATVVRPGHKKSIPLSKILNQLIELGRFARKYDHLTFLVTIAGGGYSGWSVEEVQGVYKKWCEVDPPPDNVLLKREYEFRKDE